MKKIQLLLLVCALIGTGIFLYVYHHYVQPLQGGWFPYEHLLVISLTLIFFSVFLGALLALIPFSKLPYKRRIGSAYLLAQFCCSLIFAFAFVESGPSYNRTPSSHFAECKNLRTGKYKSGDVFIVRDSLKQTETNQKTGEQVSLAIKWTGDCEYELSTDDKTFKIKIVSVDTLGYDCVVLRNGKTYNHIRVDILLDH